MVDWDVWGGGGGRRCRNHKYWSSLENVAGTVMRALHPLGRGSRLTAVQPAIRYPRPTHPHAMVQSMSEPEDAKVRHITGGVLASRVPLIFPTTLSHNLTLSSVRFPSGPQLHYYRVV